MRTLADLAGHLKLRGARGCEKSRGARGCDLPPLALLTDSARLADPVPALLRLPVGSLVVFRHYQAADRSFLAFKLARLCRERRLALLVAGDFSLAVRLGAGVHLAEGLARLAQPRLRLWHRRRRRLLTAAAHGRVALQRARAIGADAAFLGSVFPSESHPDGRCLGSLIFRRLTRRAGLPVYALGGVRSSTVGRLRGCGAAGVATVSGV